MLHHIDVQNTIIASNLLTLTLGDPSSGYIVKEITGLDPVKATLVSSTFANLDGEQYHSSRRDPRNIVITLGLKHRTTSIADLRARLYDVFMPKSEIAMSFYKADGTYLNISGVVESCESPLFVQEPSMVISIMCFDPDFVAPSVGTVSSTTVGAGSWHTFEYTGTVPTGITMVSTMNQAVSHYNLQLTQPGRPDKHLPINLAMNSGDRLTVKTTRGSRAVTVRRSGQSVEQFALYGVDKNATWLELQPGTNSFRIYSPTTGIPYTLTWSIRHGGL